MLKYSHVLKLLSLSFLFMARFVSGASTPSSCYDSNPLECCDKTISPDVICGTDLIYPSSGSTKPDTSCSSGYDYQFPVTTSNGNTLLISVVTGSNAATSCGAQCCFCKPNSTTYAVVPPPSAGSPHESFYNAYCNPNPNSGTTSSSSSSTSGTSTSVSGSSTSSSSSSSSTSGTGGTSGGSTTIPQPPSGQGYFNRNAACTACTRYGHKRSDCTQEQVLMKYTNCDGTVDTVCAPSRGSLLIGKTCGAPIIVSGGGSTSGSGSGGSTKSTGSSATTSGTATSGSSTSTSASGGSTDTKPDETTTSTGNSTKDSKPDTDDDTSGELPINTSSSGSTKN